MCEVVSHCGFDLCFSNERYSHLLMHLWTIRVSSLEKCLLIAFAHFVIGLFVVTEL